MGRTITEVFILYKSNVFGCDSEGMYVRSTVLEWIWKNTATAIYSYYPTGAKFEFDSAGLAIMFKLTWG